MNISSRKIIENAVLTEVAIPGFNIPYLPMMEPVINAIKDTRSFGFIMVARLEWMKFASGGVMEIRKEYDKFRDESFTRLHLDHVPVIDEDNLVVDYMAVIEEALELGYNSVMVDGSRLTLDENIKATRKVCEIAHKKGIAVEAELGAVFGHEEGPASSYEELFSSGKGFTDKDDAVKFVKETEVDWLSVAVGNVHGAVSKAKKDAAKVEARLNIERIKEISETCHIPLVLHGGTGINKEYIAGGIKNGIAKVNVATAIRQPYEKLMKESITKAREAVYKATIDMIRTELNSAGINEKVTK